jgi:hypothetical protein
MTLIVLLLLAPDFLAATFRENPAFRGAQHSHSYVVRQGRDTQASLVLSSLLTIPLPFCESISPQPNLLVCQPPHGGAD